MIRIIGNKNCNRCEVVKNLLKSKGVEFTYECMSEISKEEQKKISEMAKESGTNNFPIVIESDKIIDVRNIL